MKTVNKACPCVLRRTDRGFEILAFRHPRAGAQIPKGTVEDGESIAEAVLRELREETGIEDAAVVDKIGQFDRHVGAGEDEDGEMERHVWHLYHVASDETRMSWNHQPTGGGAESQLVFCCYWHNLTADDEDFGPVFKRALALVAVHIARVPLNSRL